MVILLTWAVRGVNPAPDSGLGAECPVAGSTNRPSWTSSTRWLFAFLQARVPCGSTRRSTGRVAYARTRWANRSFARSVSVGPPSVFLLCKASGTIDRMQGVARPFGPHSDQDLNKGVISPVSAYACYRRDAESCAKKQWNRRWNQLQAQVFTQWSSLGRNTNMVFLHHAHYSGPIWFCVYDGHFRMVYSSTLTVKVPSSSQTVEHCYRTVRHHFRKQLSKCQREQFYCPCCI